MKGKKSGKIKNKNLDKSEEKESVEKNSQAVKDASPSADLIAQITESAEGLFYISETDAEILPFAGASAEQVDREEMLKQINKPDDTAVEERTFSDFFARLTEIQDWYGDEEKENVKKFVRLKEVLENNVRDLKVFKIGKIELNVYVVGLDAENTFLGIQTKAVET